MDADKDRASQNFTGVRSTGPSSYDVNRQLDQVLRIYYALGLVITLLSLTYFVFTFLNINLSPPQQIALIFAGTGIVLSIGARTLLIIRRESRQNRFKANVAEQTQSRAVFEWSGFEELATVVLSRLGKDISNQSPRSLLASLLAEGIISYEQMAALGQALEVRNMLVHELGSISPELVQETIATLRAMNAHLEKNLAFGGNKAQ